jgi:membrane-associated phospholipid phosphatase
MNAISQPRTWYRQAAQALTHNLVLKSVGIPLFIAIFFGAYFYVLKHPAYPVTVMPVTWLDGMIGFAPAALPLYASLWVYVSLPPAFLADRSELMVYGGAMAATCLIALLVFYFWPSTVPPADIDWARHPGVAFLKNLDASGNACPSLHVATAVFSGMWLHRLLRRFGSPVWVLLCNGLWCMGIIYATLATRQHVAVDMWAGLLLGGLTARLSMSGRRHLLT